MDRNQVRNRILIALLAVLAVCLMLLIVKQDIPSTNKQRVVLDMLGCHAARRLGVNVTVSDADSCVLDERISLTLYWLTIGNVRIDADRVVAVQEPD